MKDRDKIIKLEGEVGMLRGILSELITLMENADTDEFNPEFSLDGHDHITFSGDDRDALRKFRRVLE